MFQTATRLLSSLLLITSLAACGVGTLEVKVDDGSDLALSEQNDLAASRGRYEYFASQGGRYYFHLLAGNGERVLSSQGYASAAGAAAGLASVRANGGDSTRYFFREAVNGEWFFVLEARNNEVIGTSQTYASRSNAERGMLTVVRLVTNTVSDGMLAVGDASFQSFRGLDGQFYFHLRAGNGEIVLQSEGYTSWSGAGGGILAVQTYGADASRYVVLEASDGQFYFVLRATNGQTVGRGETYLTREGAESGIQTCVKLLSGPSAG